MAAKNPSMRRRAAQARSGRHGLTRDRVVAEGRRLLRKEGMEALSMRTLAQRLGVSTMALYNHVSSRQDLLEAIAQDVVEDLYIPPVTSDWQHSLRAIFRALREVCLANPHAMPVIERAEVLPAIFRLMEAALAAFRHGGLGLREGMQAYFLLTNFTLGQVSYEIRGPFRGLDPGEAVRRGTILSRDLPLVVEAASTGEWDFNAAFEFGLDTIIDGLAAHSRKTPRAPRSKTRAP
jgi:TetR/AcrR family tetracycline transcriptional repressor